MSEPREVVETPDGEVDVTAHDSPVSSVRQVRIPRAGPPLHRLSLLVPHVSGMGSLTHLDQQDVRGLTGVEVRVGMNEPTEVTLRLLVQSVDMTAEAATVWYECAVVFTDGTEHHASAPSIVEALRCLAEDVEGHELDYHQHGTVEP